MKDSDGRRRKTILLEDAVRYDPETGKLYWKFSRRPNVIAGEEIKTPHSSGYISTSIQGKKYLAHRLAWFLFYKEWPEFIDHIDGDRKNNKISNLRSVTRRQNQRNMTLHRNGKLVGCTYSKRQELWLTKIRINYKQICIGAYKTEQEAHDAYMKYCKEKNLL